MQKEREQKTVSVREFKERMQDTIENMPDAQRRIVSQALLGNKSAIRAYDTLLSMQKTLPPQ